MQAMQPPGCPRPAQPRAWAPRAPDRAGDVGPAGLL